MPGDLPDFCIGAGKEADSAPCMRELHRGRFTCPGNRTNLAAVSIQMDGTRTPVVFRSPDWIEEIMKNTAIALLLTLGVAAPGFAADESAAAAGTSSAGAAAGISVGAIAAGVAAAAVLVAVATHDDDEDTNPSTSTSTSTSTSVSAAQ